MLLLLLLLLRDATATAAAADFVVVPADRSDPSAPADLSHISVLPGAGNVSGHPAPPGADGHLAVVSNAAPHFRAFGPAGPDGTACDARVRTSVTARAHGCRLATNAGPFDMSTGACDDGVFIHAGKVIGSGGWRPSLAVTGSGGGTAAAAWVLGTLNASTAAALNVTESVNGFSWLVRDGKNALANKPDTTVAPRTAAGVTRDGRLLLLEVDGCEQARNCRWVLGRTEYEMAELLLAHGAHHAINLDGGGSSSFVVNGTVVNHPTDWDLWAFKKERAVTVITCVL